MMAVLTAIWVELSLPSGRDETPYQTVVIAIAHAVLGAALIGPLMLVLTPPVVLVLVVGAYWLAKEMADLRKGGSWADGAIDTMFVGMGIGSDSVWWPALVIVVAVFCAVDRHGGQLPVRKSENLTDGET